MRPTRFDCVKVANIGELPLRSTQSSPKLHNSMSLILLLILAAGVVVPQISLAIHGLSDPLVRPRIIEQPIVAFEFAVALAFWLTLFGWPLWSLVRRLLAHRAVEISTSIVAVADRGAFGQKVWKVPLTEYLGIAHHTRSSLAGTRHELILAHCDRRKSIMLQVDDHISQNDAEHFCRLLKLPQIPARELYRLGSGKSRSRRAPPA